MPTQSRLLPHANLDVNEARLAVLLAEGNTTASIARKLGITTAEVRRRMDALSQKLNRETAKA
jgi:DNA-binding CsgD family transcriptional regulator